MTARANWFMEAVEAVDDEDDPFSMPVEEVGSRIDLRDPKASLDVRLQELVRREMSLSNGGVQCAIKDRPDTTCHACPKSEAHDRRSGLGVLCRIGREQESVLTELAVNLCQDQ